MHSGSSKTQVKNKYNTTSWANFVRKISEKSLQLSFTHIKRIKIVQLERWISCREWSEWENESHTDQAINDSSFDSWIEEMYFKKQLAYDLSKLFSLAFLIELVQYCVHTALNVCTSYRKKTKTKLKNQAKWRRKSIEKTYNNNDKQIQFLNNKKCVNDLIDLNWNEITKLKHTSNIFRIWTRGRRR